MPKHVPGHPDLVVSTPGKKGFYVYVGLDRNTKVLVYVGTTTQIPADRFRWHKHNGKDLLFFVVGVCQGETEMLDLEFNLIQRLKPWMNKIVKRKQNFNRRLNDAELDMRVGDSQWCQSCLRRRVNLGYAQCYYCSK